MSNTLTKPIPATTAAPPRVNLAREQLAALQADLATQHEARDAAQAVADAKARQLADARAAADAAQAAYEASGAPEDAERAAKALSLVTVQEKAQAAPQATLAAVRAAVAAAERALADASTLADAIDASHTAAGEAAGLGALFAQILTLGAEYRARQAAAWTAQLAVWDLLAVPNFPAGDGAAWPHMERLLTRLRDAGGDLAALALDVYAPPGAYAGDGTPPRQYPIGHQPVWSRWVPSRALPGVDAPDSAELAQVLGSAMSPWHNKY